MSLALLNAVLSSRVGKSSSRFALALMAYHACERCGRVYCGVTRLANELNVDPRNAKTRVAGNIVRKCPLTTRWLVTTDGRGWFLAQAIRSYLPEKTELDG